MVLADLSPAEFVGTLLPTMFSEATPPESVDACEASMLGFHPVGFRAMARASAENLRDVLPHIKVPTLLVYGALGLLFFVTIMPIGLVMRATGKDFLRLKRDPAAKTYWIDRTPPGPPPQSMKNQF